VNEVIYFFCVLAYAASSFVLAYLGKPAELAGFVMAGALSLAFLKLDSFKEFSAGGFSAKLKERIEAIERDIGPIKSKETEPDEVEPAGEALADECFLDKGFQEVLSALTNGKYSWRTLSGLATTTDLTRDRLLGILAKLEQRGLATTSKSGSGKKIWGATFKGHDMVAQHRPGSKCKNGE
jgi:hypothetical protein